MRSRLVLWCKATFASKTRRETSSEESLALAVVSRSRHRQQCLDRRIHGGHNVSLPALLEVIFSGASAIVHQHVHGGHVDRLVGLGKRRSTELTIGTVPGTITSHSGVYLLVKIGSWVVARKGLLPKAKETNVTTPKPTTRRPGPGQERPENPAQQAKTTKRPSTQTQTASTRRPHGTFHLSLLYCRSVLWSAPRENQHPVDSRESPQTTGLCTVMGSAPFKGEINSARARTPRGEHNT